MPHIGVHGEHRCEHAGVRVGTFRIRALAAILAGLQKCIKDRRGRRLWRAQELTSARRSRYVIRRRDRRAIPRRRPCHSPAGPALGRPSRHQDAACSSTDARDRRGYRHGGFHCRRMPLCSNTRRHALAQPFDVARGCVAGDQIRISRTRRPDREATTHTVINSHALRPGGLAKVSPQLRRLRLPRASIRRCAARSRAGLRVSRAGARR